LLRRTTTIAVVAIAVALGACSSDDDAADTTTTTEATTTTVAVEPLTILVTNDDGIGHPGIDTMVTALQGLEEVEVVVVAPATNQTGKSDSTTPGGATFADGATSSGFEGTAVDGTPADSIVVAVESLGIEPDLVVSGINQGQNLGPVAFESGTLGAGRTAARLGIPAIGGSAGIPEDTDYDAVAALVLEHITEHRSEYADGTADVSAVVSFNIPYCSAGDIQALVEVPLAAEFPEGANPYDTDCTVIADQAPTDDIEAMETGHAALTLVPLEAPPE
jgi:5'-nucleotidase